MQPQSALNPDDDKNCVYFWRHYFAACKRKWEVEIQVQVPYVSSAFIFLIFMRMHDSDTQQLQRKVTQAKQRFWDFQVQFWFG